MTYKRKERMCVCACMAETNTGFPGGSVGRRAHLPRQETQETEVQVLGQEDPLEKELATTPETSTAL